MEKAVVKQKSKTRENTKLTITRNDGIAFVMGVFSFFLGRVVLFQFLNPVMPGYLALFLCRSYAFYFVAAGGILGIFTRYSGMYFWKYGLTILFLVVIHVAGNIRGRKMKLYTQALLAAASVFTAGAAVSLIDGFGTYFIIMAFMESVLTASLALVLQKGTLVLQGKTKRKTLSAEELISLAVLLGAFIAGSGDIYIGLVSLRDFFCGIVIMIIGYKGGSALGATAGVLLGFVLSVTGYADYTFMGILSISGMFSGIPRKYGKIGSLAGYLAGVLLLTAYLAPALLTRELLFSAAMAGIGFLIMPDVFYFNMSAVFGTAEEEVEVYSGKIKELTADKLNRFAAAFQALGNSFSQRTEKKTGLNQKDINRLVDDVVNQVCVNCTKRHSCWEENVYEAYGWVYNLLSVCDKKGQVEKEDLAVPFTENCIRQHHFLDVVNRYYQLYRSNMVWHNRLIETRELVSQQLLGVSGIIAGLADELNMDMKFNTAMEENITMELAKEKVEVDNVIVLENKLGKYEVTLSLPGCGRKKACTQVVLPAVNRVLGRKMQKDEGSCGNPCRLRLVEEQRLRVVSGVARSVKQNSAESGDSYSFMELRNGQCLLALSDGMGSGKKAKEESAAAIELLEEFIDSGFDKELAVKMINSVLLLKSSEESFSTLDICSIDLYSGKTEFIKIGASSTYLIRDKSVQIIKSSTLPMGILDSVDLEVSVKKVRDNDMILMVTDGVLDSNEESGGKEKWLVDILQGYQSLNPQDMADYVLEEAQKAAKGKMKDDMTVLAARVWEKY